MRLIAPEIYCDAAPAEEGRITVHYQIRNVGIETIHILDGRHMPYLLAPDAATLVLLQGLNAPDPNILYSGTEIPLTRPLAAGQLFAGEFVLPTATLRDHFGHHPTPASLVHGTIRLRCEVGWGVSPITAANRLRISISRLLTWQRITGYGLINVTLP